MKMIMLVLLLFSFNVFANPVILKPSFTVTASGTSVQVIGKNTDRKFLGFQNRGSQSIYLKVDSPHVGTEGYELVAGEILRFEVAIPINSFYAKAASDSPTLAILEGI